MEVTINILLIILVGILSFSISLVVFLALANIVVDRIDRLDKWK